MKTSSSSVEAVATRPAAVAISAQWSPSISADTGIDIDIQGVYINCHE